MFQGIFRSTTIPVLEQVVQFTQARHEVLAGNVANLGTPGYVARDVSVEDFQARLQEAIDARAPGTMPTLHVGTSEGAERPDPVAGAAKDPRSILFHDESDNSAELQVTEMVENQLQHNTAIAILGSQFRLLEAVISERV